MAVRHGYGKIAGTDALVFAYDTGDTRNSYIGEPATNLALFSMNAGFSSDYPSNITFTDDSIVTYQGRQSKRVVATGQWNIYKYPRSGNYTATSSTTFTYSFKIKWSDGHTPYFSNGYIYTDAIATYPGITIRAIEDGWFWCYCTYNTTSSPPTLTGFTTTDTGTCWIVDWQLEAGRLHPTPYVAPGGTRSSTQGLLDLTGNSTIDLANVSFDSNAQMTFDGTSDVTYSGNLPQLDTFSLEVVLKPSALSGWFLYRNTNMNYTDNSDNFIFGFSANKLSGGVEYHPTGDDRSVISTTALNTGEYVHGVLVHDNSTLTLRIYVNGNLEGTTVSTGQSYPYRSTNKMSIGADGGSNHGGISGNKYYYSGDINVVKVYNRALTAAEVRNNYNQYKGRFNI